MNHDDDTPGPGDEPTDDALIEEVAGAWRPRDPRQLRFHPYWHDLSEEARVEAYDRARENRALEAALDPDGLSSTARAVLARIVGG